MLDKGLFGKVDLRDTHIAVSIAFYAYHYMDEVSKYGYQPENKKPTESDFAKVKDIKISEYFKIDEDLKDEVERKSRLASGPFFRNR